jgi:hypothetical protein
MKNLEDYLQSLPVLDKDDKMRIGRNSSYLRKVPKTPIKEEYKDKPLCNVIEELIASGEKPSTANGDEIYQIGDFDVGLIVYNFAESYVKGTYKTVDDFANITTGFYKDDEQKRLRSGQAKSALHALTKGGDKTKHQAALDMIAEGMPLNIGYKVKYKIGEVEVGKMAYDYAVFLVNS